MEPREPSDRHERVRIVERFLLALAVTLGDRRARLALDRTPPDFAAAREGFAAGGNDADDIAGMIRLCRYFGRAAFMRDAVSAWVEIDA